MNSIIEENLEYYLPKELIAQTPIEPRDASRLLVLDRKTEELKDDIFRNVINYLTPTDVLVLNDTKVLPARVYCRKKTGGKVEILLLNKTSDSSWECLVKPSIKKPKETLFVNGTPLELEINPSGTRIVTFPSVESMEEIITKHGRIPLPPYIKTKLTDESRYQTVFAKKPGSVAGHTAALHFTEELLSNIQKKGVKITFITLHMGLDSFRIIRNINDYKLAGEYCQVTEETAELINQTKKSGGRVVACGTSVVRTLESASDEKGYLHPFDGKATIFIQSGYKFKIVDALITNFHLPRTTNLLLVYGFATRELTLKAYEYAVNKKYRFYTFGDAMFIK